MKYDTQHTHDREIAEVSKLLDAWKREQDDNMKLDVNQTPAEKALYSWITTGGWDSGLKTHEEVHEHGRD